jgi:hypothetical protein
MVILETHWAERIADGRGRLFANPQKNAFRESHA